MSDRMKCPICGYGDATKCDCFLPNYITATNEARRWARKLYRENAELRRQIDMLIKIQGFITTEFVEMETLSRQLETLMKIQNFITTEMGEYSDGQLSDDEIVKDVYARLNRAFVEIERLKSMLEELVNERTYRCLVEDAEEGR